MANLRAISFRTTDHSYVVPPYKIIQARNLPDSLGGLRAPHLDHEYSSFAVGHTLKMDLTLAFKLYWAKRLSDAKSSTRSIVDLGLAQLLDRLEFKSS